VARSRAKPPSIGAKASLPGFVEPALASSIEKVPTGDRWIHEVKFDGYRVQVHLANAAVKIFTRRGNDWTNRFKKIADDAWHLNAGSAIIDGEVIVPSENGVSDFSMLQNELRGKSNKLVLYAFDLFYLKLNVVIFDKTGTLTMGKPEVVDLVTASGASEDQLLAAAAAVDTGSDHPLAQAIMRRAANVKVPKATGFQEPRGQGHASRDRRQRSIARQQTADDREQDRSRRARREIRGIAGRRTDGQFADATLGFLREKVPRNWADICDSVTDNFRIINPKDFRVVT
jgi:ATP dependent DNA ligase domain/haloacid dehalogenase-like hydrolase